MSRDFLVMCDGEAAAREAQRILEQVAASDGSRIFEVDNRGRDLLSRDHRTVSRT